MLLLLKRLFINHTNPDSLFLVWVTCYSIDPAHMYFCRIAPCPKRCYGNFTFFVAEPLEYRSHCTHRLDHMAVGAAAAAVWILLPGLI